MAKFKYRAKTKTGDLQVGFVDALDRNDAVNILSSHDLYVLFVDDVKSELWYDKILNYFNRVKRKDLMIFTRQFATLVSAKIPLDNALETLKRQTRNVTLKNIIGEMSADIEAGLSLSQAMGKHKMVFSEFYVNMMRSAEVTGRIDEAMQFLADYIEKQAELVSGVRNALIYPIIMIVLFFAVGGIMVVIVFPQIGPVFEEAGVDLPIFTKILINGGNMLSHWWWAFLLLFGVGGVVGYDYLRTEEGKTLMGEIAMRTPGVKNLFKGLYVARFTESLAVLIKGGIPISQAIDITGRTISNAAYRDALRRTSTDVRKGITLSQSLAQQEKLFPPLVSQMIAVGESSGQLVPLLHKISEFYTREVEGLINALVELIQPLLLVVIGVLVGGLFASILIPIYNLAQSF